MQLDEDGDEITITCDEDLLTAITEMTNRVKILYITILEKAKPGDIEIEAEIRCKELICNYFSDRFSKLHFFL